MKQNNIYIYDYDYTIKKYKRKIDYLQNNNTWYSCWDLLNMFNYCENKHKNSNVKTSKKPKIYDYSKEKNKKKKKVHKPIK